MKSQTHTIIFHSAVVADKKGRPYTIKYATQQNKSHTYKKKKEKKWLDTIDAQSATTQKPTVQELPESPPELTGKSGDTETTTTVTSAPTK